MKFKMIYPLIFLLMGIANKAQEIKIWNKALNTNIIIHQQMREDSVYS